MIFSGKAKDIGVTIDALLSGGTFDPETTSVLVTAFETAWETVKRSGSHLASAEREPMTRELLAKQIIRAAQAGERDPKKLINDGLTYLATLR